MLDAVDVVEKLLLAHFLACGNHGLLERSAHDFFNPLNLALFAQIDEAEADTPLIGTTCTTAAVNVGFDVVGQVIINNVRQFLHVDATGGHVGSHQQLQAAFAEMVHHIVAHCLGKVAMQCSGVVAVLNQVVGNLLRFQLGAAKDDAVDGRRVVDDALQHHITVLGGHHVIDVVDVGGAGVALAHGHLHGVGHVLVEDGFHLFRHGGREKHGVAAFLGHVFEDVVDFLLEAHVEHFVGLVENHRLHVAEIHAVAANHIAQATRSGHDNLRLLGQIFELYFDAGAAVNGHNQDFWNVLGIVAQVAGNLHTKFARRTKNQRLDASLRFVNLVQQRQTKSGSLTCSRLCKAHKVNIFLQEYRNRLLLYRHRILKPQLLYSLQQSGIQSKIGKL